MGGRYERRNEKLLLKPTLGNREKTQEKDCHWLQMGFSGEVKF